MAETVIFYKKTTFLIGLICLWNAAFLLVSCQPPTTENRVEQLTQGACGCATRLLELNQQAAQSPEKADFKALENEFNKTKECIGAVAGRFGKLKTDERAQLEAQLRLKCPQLAAQRDLLEQLLAE